MRDSAAFYLGVRDLGLQVHNWTKNFPKQNYLRIVFSLSECFCQGRKVSWVTENPLGSVFLGGPVAGRALQEDTSSEGWFCYVSPSDNMGLALPVIVAALF